MIAEFIFEFENDADLIYKALKPEEGSSRTKSEIYLNKNVLKILIIANNLTELRAATNAWLRFIKACVESLEVLEWKNYHLSFKI